MVILGLCWFFFIFNGGFDQQENKYKPEEITSLIISGDIDQARELVKAELDKDGSLEIRRQLANVEEAAGNNDRVIEAYSVYLDNSSDELNADDYGKIAMAYENSEDKVNAALYYRKSADVMGRGYLSADKEYLYNYADILEGKTSDGL